jgi:hypothetical protein
MAEKARIDGQMDAANAYLNGLCRRKISAKERRKSRKVESSLFSFEQRE